MVCKCINNMKQYIHIFLLVVFLFLCSFAAQSQSFSVNNIYYKVISTSPTYKVKVTRNPSHYTGVVSIPESVIHGGHTYAVTSIGDSAFYMDTLLTRVFLPTTIDTVGNRVFYVNHNSLNVYCFALTPPITSQTFYDRPSSQTDRDTLHIQCSSYNVYRNSDTTSGGSTNYWKRFRNILGIGDTVEYWDTICQLDTFNLHGFNRYIDGSYVSGTFDSTFHTQEGCDYNVTVHLHVKPAYRNEFNYYVCNNSDIHYHTHGFDVDNQLGSWTHNNVTYLGCDSISVLNIRSINTDTVRIQDNICEGMNYMANGFLLYGGDGGDLPPAGQTYVDVISAPRNNDTYNTYQSGCSAIIQLTLHIQPNISDTTYASICSGDYYAWNVTGYTQNTSNGSYYSNSHTVNHNTSGTYIDTSFSSQYGCFSRHVLVLTTLPSSSSVIYDTICEGERYTSNGFNVSDTGTYTRITNNYRGCDSTITLHLYHKQAYGITNFNSVYRGNIYSTNFNSVDDWNLINSTTYTNKWYIRNGYLFVSNYDYGSNYAYNIGNPSYIYAEKNIYIGNYDSMNVSFNLNVGGEGSYDDLTVFLENTNATAYYNSIAGLSNIYSFNGTKSVTIPVPVNYRNTNKKIIFYWKNDGSGGSYPPAKIDNLYITGIKHSSVNSTGAATIINHSICQGSSYYFNGHNLTTAGSYYDTLSTTKGCDSIITLVLTINPRFDTVLYKTICQNQVYNDYHFHNLTTSGTYRDTTQNTVTGCDSTFTLHLSVHSRYDTTINIGICQNTSYNFNGRTITTAGTYMDTLSSISGCDSIVHLHLTVNPIYRDTIFDTICQGQTYNSHNITATIGGTYSHTFQSIHGCDSIIVVHLTVNPSYTSTINASICQGSVYTEHGFHAFTSGIYRDTLQTVKGCDSVLILNLTVIQKYLDTITANICQGGTYTSNGFNTNVAGYHTDSLLSVSGCDSIVTLNLIVNPNYDTNITRSICANSSFNFNGRTITSPGNYLDTLSSIYGCDSIVHLTLISYPIYNDTIRASIRQGETYTLNGFNTNTAGSYTNNLHSIHGCDSTVHLILVVFPNYDTNIYAHICQGERYTSNGFDVNSTGLFTRSLRSIHDCDSIVHLHLTVYPIYKDTISAQICQGQSYNANNFNHTSTGIYTDSLQTINGCDSIVTLNLTVNPVYDTSITESICYGHNFNFNGRIVNTAGIYNDTLPTIRGCDSIIHLNLVVFPVYDTTIVDSICLGATYTRNGFNVSLAGNYIDTLQTINGCDSIVRLNLRTVNYNDTIFAGICYGERYTLNNFNENVSGLYTDSLTSVFGCDSVVTLALTVHPLYNDTIIDTICANYPYTLNNFYADTTGLYTDSLQSQYGCDSVVTLNLTVKPNYVIPIEREICEGETYINHGYNITHSGTYLIDSLTASNGCDSVFVLDLTVHPTYDQLITAEICQGETYSMYGFNESTTGIYRDTIQGFYGCDSAFTLNLIVHPTYNLSVHDVLCQGSTYNFNNRIINAPGTYMDTLQSMYGCDSIVWLTLTLKPTYNINIVDSICQGVAYNFNGRQLTETGTYIDTLATIDGCDSIINLRFKVNQPYKDSIAASICEGETYNLHGFNATESGRYTRLLQTEGGCDSLKILNLTVFPAYHDTINASICHGQIYNQMGFVVDSAGTYTHSYQTDRGCDSILTLNLSVYDNKTKEINAEICEGETYTENNFNENTTGTYVRNLQTTNGCDSTVTLHLVVKPVKTTNLNATTCQGTPYTLNGFNADTAGTYTQVLQTTYGCDSTVVLHLSTYPTYNDTIIAEVEDGETYREYNFNEHLEGAYSQYLQSQYGCDSTTTLILSIADGVHLYVPNAFTPLETTNSTFHAYTDQEDVHLKTFQIFNRFGALLYETSDIKQGWDGKYKDSYCQQGTYTYRLVYYRDKTPNKYIELKGAFALIY
jgi:gliding motility-associated-like protein